VPTPKPAPPRPPKRSVFVSLLIADEQCDLLDKLAVATPCTRSSAMRRALQVGLETLGVGR